jgi:glutathione peroxidase
MSIYDFVVHDAKGNDVDLSQYKGKVLLIVNTATGCGFTPQYKGLQQLYDRYKDQGLEILDFPCNQFLGQAPGTNEEITSFCEINYGVTFKTFAKINVNGKNAEPLYKYLKQHTRGALGTSVKWNFTKFLISKDGELAGRFAPNVEPLTLEKEIKALL